MSSRNLKALLIIIALVWLIPWKGKSLWPEVFGASYVQMSSTILIAILAPLGFIISLIHLSSPQNKSWPLAFLGIGFLIIPVVNMTFIIISQILLTETLVLIISAGPPDDMQLYNNTTALIRGLLEQMSSILLIYIAGFVFTSTIALLHQARKSGRQHAPPEGRGQSAAPLRWAVRQKRMTL